MSTTSPFLLPLGCSLGVARACPVLGLGLVLVRGAGVGLCREGGRPAGCAQPQKTSLGICHMSPPQIWFHFSFPLARNNWPGGWTSVAVGGTLGRAVAWGSGGLRPAGRWSVSPLLLESPSPACWEAPGLSQVLLLSGHLGSFS